VIIDVVLSCNYKIKNPQNLSALAKGKPRRTGWGYYKAKQVRTLADKLHYYYCNFAAPTNSLFYSLNFLNLSAFVTTETEENAIAAAAIAGLSKNPKNG